MTSTYCVTFSRHCRPPNSKLDVPTLHLITANLSQHFLQHVCRLSSTRPSLFTIQYSSRSFNNYSHNFMFNRLLKVFSIYCALTAALAKWHKIYDHNRVESSATGAREAKEGKKKNFPPSCVQEIFSKIPNGEIKVRCVNSRD